MRMQQWGAFRAAARMQQQDHGNERSNRRAVMREQQQEHSNGRAVKRVCDENMVTVMIMQQ